jgi:hypothetical protein
MADNKPSLWGLIMSMGLPELNQGRYNAVRYSLSEGNPLEVFEYGSDIMNWRGDTKASNLLEYINQFDVNDPEVKDILTNYARLISSDEMTAIMGAPMITAADNILFGNLGPYYGQSLDVLREGYTEEEISSYFENLDVESPPNLRDIFFGLVTPEEEGLQETSLRPSQGYPFKGDKVYDAEPYIVLQGLISPESDLHFDTEYRASLFHKAINLQPKEGFRIEEPHFITSMDLGESNWSIGKDEDGRLYAAIADIWDFGGGTLEGYGEIMEMVGENAINLYARIYLDDDIFFNNQYNQSY